LYDSPNLLLLLATNSLFRLHDPNIIMMSKLRGMRWAGHVARMGHGNTKFLWKLRKEETTGRA
jgi:hypothetical protein